jgi:hypothetical protein
MLPIEPDHYETYFRWRLEHLEGPRLLYQRIADALEDRRPPGATTFAEASLASRGGAIADLARTAHAADVLGLQREVLALFARTDAWVHLGYDGWPGTARGFGAGKPSSRSVRLTEGDE